MKKWLFICLACQALSVSAIEENSKIRYVDFKTCVEESKIGKQEQASFEAMKKQMENVFEEKDKVLTELANKLNNIDELELMSVEAETELKRKYRALSQEMSQIQTQFYQTLSQSNLQIVQKLREIVTKASEKVAKNLGLDFVIDDEGTFFANKKLDISSLVINEMDANYVEEVAKPTPTTTTGQ